MREARQLNPKLKVLARTADLRKQAELRAAGADETFAREGEVALSMTEHILREFGATSEQIERESERIRDELFEPTTRNSLSGAKSPPQ